jgi:alpha-ribazole phosphatase
MIPFTAMLHRINMEVYLVRHTTPAIPLGLCYGRDDVAVAASFEFEAAAAWTKLIQAQAKPALARATDRFEPSHVFSSSLQRCSTLARTLTLQPVTFDERLLEVDFGRWENQSWDRIPAEQIQAWERDPLHYAPPDGESAFQVAQRVKSFADDLRLLDANAKVLIVSHGGPIYMLIATLLAAPLTVAMNLRVDYGSVTRVDVGAGRLKLICLNH